MTNHKLAIASALALAIFATPAFSAPSLGAPAPKRILEPQNWSQVDGLTRLQAAYKVCPKGMADYGPEEYGKMVWDRYHELVLDVCLGVTEAQFLAALKGSAETAQPEKQTEQQKFAGNRRYDNDDDNDNSHRRRGRLNDHELGLLKQRATQTLGSVPKNATGHAHMMNKGAPASGCRRVTVRPDRASGFVHARWQCPSGTIERLGLGR